MSLLFAGANTDRVDLGSPASLSGLTSGTILAWVNPSAIAARFLYGSRRTAAGASALTVNMDASGFLHLVVAGTTAFNFTTNNQALVAGTWYFVAGTFVFGSAGHVYVGTLTSILAESTYSASVTGATQTAETAGTVLWGDRYNASAVAPGSWSGQIALGQVYNRALSLGELRSLQFNPQPLSGCKAYHRFGWNSVATQPDWSGNGNAGTVTGATQAADVPLRAMAAFGPQHPYQSFQAAWARGSNQHLGSGLYAA